MLCHDPLFQIKVSSSPPRPRFPSQTGLPCGRLQLQPHRDVGALGRGSCAGPVPLQGTCQHPAMSLNTGKILKMDSPALLDVSAQ